MTSISRSRSATKRLSLAFSWARRFNSATCEGAMPPKRLRPLYSICSETPCLRATAAALSVQGFLHDADDLLFSETNLLHIPSTG